MAGDVMVDRSIRVERLRPLSLRWTAARKRESRQLRELARSLGVIWEVWAWRKIGMKGVSRLGNGLERLGPELAQRVKAAAGELSGERQRRPGMRESALLERQIVGAVGARGTAGRLR